MITGAAARPRECGVPGLGTDQTLFIALRRGWLPATEEGGGGRRCIGTYRPSSMTTPIPVLYQSVLDVRPANALPLVAVPDVIALHNLGQTVWAAL